MNSKEASQRAERFLMARAGPKLRDWFLWLADRIEEFVKTRCFDPTATLDPEVALIADFLTKNATWCGVFARRPWNLNTLHLDNVQPFIGDLREYAAQCHQGNENPRDKEGRLDGGRVPRPALSNLQTEILKALDGKMLRKEDLKRAVGVKTDLYKRRPGTGLTQLVKLGLVASQRSGGYYRPDAPPPHLAP